MSAFSSPFLLSSIERVGWAIVNSCWLGAIYAIALAFTLRALRTAAARHFACMLALVLTLGSTVAITAKVTSTAGSNPSTERSSRVARVAYSAEASRLPARTVPGEIASAQRLASDRARSPSSDILEPRFGVGSISVRQWPQLIAPALPWLSLSWFIGVILLSLRHFGGWCRVWTWRRSAKRLEDPAWHRLTVEIGRKLGLRRLAPIMQSAEVLAPMLTGTVRPMVLLPLRVVTGFSEGELEAILAHELAHLARGDAWANLLQLLCETLLFYHPAVWWMSRQTRIERENAADDLATEACADRLQYANALARLAEQTAGPHVALAANGGTLVARIRRLLAPGSRSSATSGWAAGALALGGVICIILLATLRAPSATADEPQKTKASADGSTAPVINQAVSKTPDELAQKAADDAKSWIEDAFQLEDKGKREGAIERIRAAMKSGNADEARAGVTAFVRLGPIEFDKAAFRPEVRVLLASQDVPTRAAAASAFTLTGADAEDLDRILALADDPAAEVREPLTGIIVRLTKGDLTGKPASDAILKLMNNLPRDSRSVAHAMWGVKFSPEIEARVLEFCREILYASNGSIGYNFFYGSLSTQANKSDASCRRLIELLAHQDTTNIAGRSAWGLQQGVAREQFPLVADAMVKVIEARSDGYLRNNALRCLRTYGDARQAPAMKALLAKPGVTGEFRKFLEETLASIEKRPAETSDKSVSTSGARDNTASKTIAPVVLSPAPSAGETETADIEVEWRGRWWPAKALKKEGGRTLIHYVGYGSEWDETVPPDRIRPLNSKDTAAQKASDGRQETTDAASTAQLVEQNRRAARLRDAEDRRHYSPEQLREIETLYQVANTKGHRSEEAKTSLKQLLEKYDKANRTGCATLYLGQASVGAERLEYLTRAVEKFSDCYYFNGCQVGGYGRYVLALTLWDMGEKDKARALFAELKTTYKDATSHRGERMGKIAETVEKELENRQGGSENQSNIPSAAPK